MKDCIFCFPKLAADQQIVLSNQHCMFLQLQQVQAKGSLLAGSGLIVPREHKETAFELSEEEWKDTYSLLQEVKAYLDAEYQPQGYNLGWNCGEVGGQHIFHSHFHVIPRYKDEPLSGKGIRSMFKSSQNKRFD